MTSAPNPDPEKFDALHARILGRPHSMFADDIVDNRDRLGEAVAGSRVLVVGAAGSTGSAFVRLVARLGPRALHLVDINENTLVEMVRDLRSSALAMPDDFQTFSIDIGGVEFARFLEASDGYDHFANFSALKHVRAERDPFSLMRMIDVNVRALHECLDRMAHAETGAARAFSVSTDKSVRPVNLMGASKALMERVLFCRARPEASSARFANVAFSAGSLLEGFQYRLAKNQPLAAPADIRRYLISHSEAGELCLLAAFLGGHREIYTPLLSPEHDLVSFAEIAEAFLESHGYKALICASEEEAKTRIGAVPKAWPCYVAPSDTTGEKPIEEFHVPDETLDRDRYRRIGVVRAAGAERAGIDEFLTEIALLRREATWDKASIAAAIGRAVPELAHQELGRSLDAKM